MILTKARKGLRIASAIAYGYRHSLRAHPPNYVDIGARGGLDPKWRALERFDLINPIFFEPDPAAAAQIQSANPNAIVAPYALGASDNERATLFITREPGRSSVLRPNPAKAGIKDISHWDVVSSTEIITLRRLDAVWQTEWGDPTYIKVDVQGFELEVLKGMGSLLSKVKCLQVEASFVPVYEGHTVFSELHQFLRNHRFDLVKFKPLGLYGVEILELDCFYVRSDCHGLAEAEMWKIVNDVGDHRRIVTWGY
jgi:FkbM family methyltransferase